MNWSTHAHSSRLVPAFAFLGLLLALLARGDAFEVPGKLPDGPVILEHATIHTVNFGTIEDGVLVFDQGKITRIGGAVGFKPPEDARALRVDLSGKHVYPAMIDADTAMGLIEIDAVRATVDLSEAGSLNPNARGSIAFNPDSEMIPVARAGGVLLTVSAPRGGLISGQASLMRLDGWTGDEMTIVPSVGIHVNWPSARRGTNSKEDEKGAGRLGELQQMLETARAYAKSVETDDDFPFDARLAAMVPVVEGAQPIFVHTDRLSHIQEAVAFGERESIRIVIVGGYDAPRCSSLLKRHEVPVIITGTHRLPRRRHADYDEPFRIPSQLHESGVKFCLAGYSRFSASLVQNLADQAGTAVAHGLAREDAIRAVTLSPAEILGVADRYGSLEAGKSATMIVTDGDLLEVTTHVERAWLDGRPVDLNNRHKRLWEKYRQRYE